MVGDPPPTPSLPDDNALLLAWLSTHDAPCPACKYNLRNLTVPRCPECGRPLSLAITTAQPFLRTWIATVLFLCSNAFPSVYFWISITHDLLQQRHVFFPDEWRFRFLTIFYLAATPLAVASLFLRQLFMRVPRPLQIVIVIALAAITSTGFTIIISQLI